MEYLTGTDINNLPTPFFLFDETRFRENVQAFRKAMTACHPDIILGYSIKTNYLPRLCLVAKEMGCYAEVVSTMELELAAKLKFPKGNVIFNGPYKTPENISIAISLGGYIHLDSLEQVQMLLGLPKAELKNALIGLRVNVDLTSDLDGRAKIAKGGVVPRFGMPVEDVATAVEMIRNSGCDVISLHGHASSSDRSPINYTRIAQLLLDIAKDFELNNLELLDVGGGFAGELPETWIVSDPPSFEDYASAIFAPLISDAWFQSRKIKVGIEPGMSIVANCLSYVTGIVSRKKIAGQNLLGVDGNYFDVRPTLHRKVLPAKILGTKSTNHETISYIVVGATCMERDILLESLEASVDASPGDRIRIENLGAYTFVLSPDFINYSCAIYGQKSDGTLYSMRRAQRLEDFFVTYDF